MKPKLGAPAWQAARGREEGPLFCPIIRGGNVDIKRLSASEMRELCIKRADQAGVVPFAPNDLSRSGLVAANANKRRGRTAPMAKVSPLYEPEAEAEEQVTSRIHFPYRARPSL